MKLIRLLFTSGILFFGLLSGWSQTLDFNRVSAEEEFRTGVVAFHNGFYNRAILAFEKSLSFQPDRILTRYWLGNTLFFSGYENSAINEWDNVIRLNPQNTALQAWLETIRFRRGVNPLVLPRDRMLPLSEIPGELGNRLRFQGPSGIRPLPNGGFLATVFASNDVLQISLNGDIIRRFPSSVEGFLGPMDIDQFEQFYYVTEFRADRIAVVNDLGIRQYLIGQRGRGPGQLLGPQFITIDSVGGLYVTEWGNRRVSKFRVGQKSEFLFHIGAGELKRPSGITLAGPQRNTLIVADKELASLFIYDLNGNKLNQINDSRLREAEGIWTDEQGVVWVAAGRRVLLFDVDRNRIEPLDQGWEQGARLNYAIVDQNGHIVVSDILDNTFRLYAPGSSLYSALAVRVQRISTQQYPKVFMEVVVEDRLGRPVVGLESKNFFLKESDLPIREFVVDTAGWAQQKLDVSIVLDRMPFMFTTNHAQQTSDVLRSLVSAFQQSGGVWLYEASEIPVQIENRWTNPGQAAQLAFNPLKQTERGKLDVALRLGGTSLISGVGKRSVVLLTTGNLRIDAFKQYDLIELAQFYRNNLISFHVIKIGQGQLSEDLIYLTQQTGGMVFEGLNFNINQFSEKLRQRLTPNYVIQYNTITPPENGLRYIPVSAEVNVFRKSGRNESGYFAPLNQRVFN